MPRRPLRSVTATRVRAGGGPTLEHPWRIVATAVSGGTLAWIVAAQEPVPGWELELTRWLNGAPDWSASMLYPVMQLGTLGAPIGVALLILARTREWSSAAAVLVGGVVAWFGAKGVKDVVERGRPLTYLPEIDVREGSGRGLGFISGHSAVAMFTAVTVLAVLPRRWRPVALAAAAAVGVARIVYGAHLPADVVGGWAFGALLGVGAVSAIDRARRPSVPIPDR